MPPATVMMVVMVLVYNAAYVYNECRTIMFSNGYNDEGCNGTNGYTDDGYNSVAG